MSPNTKSRGIINRPSLTELVYERLHYLIMSQQLAPGMLCTEAGLAKELRVSRTPVREALFELAALGLVVFVPRRGVRIRHYTAEDVDEVFEIRTIIETATVRKAISAFEPGCALEAVLESCWEAARNDNRESFANADCQFHLAICELGGNERLLQMLKNLEDIVRVMTVEASANPRGRINESLREHQRIFEAIRDKNTRRATLAMKDHLDKSKRAAREIVETSEQRDGAPEQANPELRQHV